MVSFEKIMSDHNFSFEENTTSKHVYFNITADIYAFKMIPDEQGWKIVGDVPPWLLAIETKLSDIIDMQLM
jgi:hypothetical protein